MQMLICRCLARLLYCKCVDWTVGSVEGAAIDVFSDGTRSRELRLR